MQEENDNTISLENDNQWSEERRLLNMQNTISVEPIEFIHAKFIYLNNHDYIENIVCQNIPLTLYDKGSILKKEQLIKIIQQKKIKTKDTQFKFLDVILCNFSIPSSSIFSFSKNNNLSDVIQKYVKKVSAIEDLFIEPSIFPFHTINNLYFFFEEHDNEKRPPSLKSILKAPEKNNPPKLTKKKVRISLANLQKDKTNKKPKQTKKKKITS